MLNQIKEKIANNWPTIRSAAWRFVRGAFATAFAQTAVMTCGELFQSGAYLECFAVAYQKWTDPKQAAAAIGISLASGFLMALGVAIREWFGNEDKSKGVVNKLPL